MSFKKYTIYTIWILKIYYKNTIFFWFWSGRPVHVVLDSPEVILSNYVNSKRFYNTFKIVGETQKVCLFL